MPSALRLTLIAYDMQQAHSFSHFPVRIGRDPGHELPLSIAFISRRHARIELEDGRLVLYDEGSLHGTYVRGMSQRVRDRVVLADVGNEFQIGPLEFRVALIDGASPAAATDSRSREHRAR